MKTFILAFLSLGCSMLYGQNVTLSPQAEFSIVTLGPDQEEFYEAFGHSAIRLLDPVNNIDYAYNYGVFSFNQPHFYLNFAKGHLNYALAIHPYPDFRDAYISYNRYVHEQQLALTQSQKQQIFEFLQWNAQPENRFYLYDYFFNNCSTRIRDLFEDLLKNEIKFDQSFIKTNYTIRQLTDLYLDEQPWGDLGIDIGLGSRIDQRATPYEYMYLPDYLESSFDHATNTIDGKVVPIVAKKIIVYAAHEEPNAAGWLNPWIVFGLVLIITCVITFNDFRKKRISKWLDAVFLCVTGLLGIVLMLLWFATDHHACARNYNLLWAVPLNIVAGIFIWRRSSYRWLSLYFKILSVLTIIILLGWAVLPQQLNIFLLPLIAAFAVRYAFLGWVGLPKGE